MSRRSMNPGFDQRIADWLEDDPDDAPEAVLTTVLAAFPSIPQRRGTPVPWRFQTMSLTARLVAAAIALAVVAVGGAIILRPSRPDVAATPSTSPTSSPSSLAVVSPSASAQADWSFLPGRLLVEHLGNAPDLSESSATDYNGGTRRFYFMDPKDMTARTVTEFLKGQPATGKSAADISSDQKKIVFQDYTAQARLYEANLDGTGFRKLPVDCTCVLLYPDYDPTATKVVYVRIQGGQSWLEILDLATAKVTKLTATVGPSTDAVPEQPAWSPDGTKIAFSRISWGSPNEPDIGTVHFGDRAPLSGTLSLLDVAAGTESDLLHGSDLSPGDPNWSPDSHTIVFAAGPLSTTAGVAADFPHRNYAIQVDGTGLRVIPGLGSPEYLPDGQHILYKSDCVDNVPTNGQCDGRDNFGVMRADFNDPLRVNVNGMDVTDLAQGFSQVGHWIDTP